MDESLAAVQRKVRSCRARAGRVGDVNDSQPSGSAPRSGLANGTEQFVRIALRQIRRLAILVCGLTVVLIGLIMFFTPGPGLVIVPLGLAILAVEFVWARRLLQQVRDRAARLRRPQKGNEPAE